MPRHLISDAHEWINEIPTVPTYYLAKPQPRERAWDNQRGKKTLLSLTLVSSTNHWDLLSPKRAAILTDSSPACAGKSMAGQNRHLPWNHVFLEAAGVEFLG